MIWIEGVSLRMGHDDIWRSLTNEIGQARQGLSADVEGVVTQIQALEGCP